jgi:hypothetical protein
VGIVHGTLWIDVCMHLIAVSAVATEETPAVMK